MKTIKKQSVQTFLAIIISLLIVSCSSEQTAWEKTVEQNTITSYRLFKTNYPNSKFITEAENAIEEFFWKEALLGNSSKSYDSYLSKYPDGKYVQIAIQKKEDALWEDIKRGVPYEKLKEFIANYPKSIYIDEARDKLEPCLWNEAVKADSYSKYKNYVKEYPNGEYADIAKDKMDDSYWKSMSRPKRDLAMYSFNLLRYVHEFPNGKHKAEAYQLMKANVKELNKVKIYTRNGCERCKFAVNYLKQHRIEYIEYKTSDKRNVKSMWKEIKRSKKHYRNSVTMPVIVFNNKCYFDIPDLKTRLELVNSYHHMKAEDKILLNKLKRNARYY